MLTEFFDIERGLSASGVHPLVRHPDLHPLAKRHILRARVGAEGEVVSVDVIRDEQAAKFWTLRDGNQNSFPRVPIGSDRRPCPLRPGVNPNLIQDLLSRDRPEAVQRFLGILDRTPLVLEGILPWPSYRTRLRERIEALKSLDDTPARAVPALLRRFLFTQDGSESDGSDILRALDSAIARALADGPDPEILKLAAKILFTGDGEVFLDTNPLDDFPRTACDPRNQDEITYALSRSGKIGPSARCALSGVIDEIEDGKFPEAALPVVGPTYLCSKNTDTPSTFRYGVAGPQGFPVSRVLANRLKAAAEALTADDRRGKTWSRVPSERPQKRGKPSQDDLLLAFVPGQQDMPAAAGLAEDEAAFEELASRLIALWRGKRVAFNAQARFVLLRRVDRGNRKVVFSTGATLDQLASAAERWTAGCRNIPKVHMPGATRGEPRRGVRTTSSCVEPGALVRLGREIFIRGGSELAEAPGPTFRDAMGLFLGAAAESRQPIARRLLGLFVSRRGPLLESVARSLHRGESKGVDARGARRTITVFGLILSELSRDKEAYMNEAAFQLGQLFAGADILHRGFCEHQREGSIPSSLLGSQAMAIAQRSPVAALNMLCGRWRVYAGWAERSRNTIAKPDSSQPENAAKREAKNKAWAAYRGARIIHRLRPLAEGLHSGSLPERADACFRAELLLGYIAGPPASQREPPESLSEMSKIDEED